MEVKLRIEPLPDEEYTQAQAEAMIGRVTEFNGHPATVVEARRVKDGGAIHFTLEVQTGD